jgi:acetamidase/formamidase
LASRHTIKRETFHYKWDRTHKPVLSIKSGDTVTFEINEVTSWQITKKKTSEDLKNLDNSKLYPLTGPVYVEGAKPGDTLVIHVDRVKTGRFGWSAIIPGLGLLEEFSEPYLHKWDLTAGKFTKFKRGVRIPIKPFCGVLGVAPPEAGSFDVMPPGKHGGNLDIRHLTAGATLELPVWVEGALFSTGDVHAAMGDGEVCVTAIECDGEATFSFELKKRTNLKWPRYSCAGELPPKKGYYATTGIAPDLTEATKESVRNMIRYLTTSRGLSSEEAYILCSVAADVRVHEIVDRPNWVVGAMMPLDIFTR